MKIAFALVAIVALAPAAFGRSWPKWISAHVSEIRFRDGVPGVQIRAATDRGEIDKILAIFRRAQDTREKGVAAGTWRVCVDMTGERPEAGRWLLNLDTGNCTFLDPLAQSIYRLAEDDRKMMKEYFEPKQRANRVAGSN
jgi:hypothetical protein